MPSLRHHLDLAASALRQGPHPERARLDAEFLLLHIAGKNKAWLMAHADDELSAAQASGYGELIERRLRGEPIQYIIGEAEFYGLPFRVTPDVLIPRPETEHLVEKALELAAQVQDAGAKAQIHDAASATRLKSRLVTKQDGFIATKNIRIVDIGTGSGAIAVALAYKLPHSQITAIDISAPALAIARENAQRNGVALRFLEGDLLAPVSGEQFELIVSNPPYIPAADRATLSVEVRDYEPALALFSGPEPDSDGLAVYRRLVPAAFAALTPGGFLALEIGCGQSPSIGELLARSGFESVEFAPDLQGIPRVTSARRP